MRWLPAHTTKVQLSAYVLFGSLLILIVTALVLSTVFIKHQYETALKHSDETATLALFPVGVDPLNETITEQPNLSEFVSQTLSLSLPQKSKESLLKKIERVLVQSGLYQQLASPSSRVLVIWPGERREEVVENFVSILGWDSNETKTFTNSVRALSSTNTSEGFFYPDRYVVSLPASPETVAQMINTRFNENVTKRYPADIENTLPLTDTLIIASLLEREAYSFEHMRLISGVIWNRLFIDMPLQIDATLQYARASANTPTWWPVPGPDDKWVDSPFNTYQNKGLPPEPIANPSVAAIVATLNPYRTNCLFYFHDTDGEIYCSETYEQHVASLVEIFGQGR